ncbi:MAG: FAD:protein FMN transferase [Gammaproteobacteria bacterium]
MTPLRWRGRLLGAPADILLFADSHDLAESALASARDVVRRLDGVFNLLAASSVVSALNRRGVLADAPAELTEILALCRVLHRASDGAFDPSVQPLWQLYSAHFSQPGKPVAGPIAAARAVARAKVGFDHVHVDGTTVRFGRPGMALTLNGIAQGYVTDRVRDVLVNHGLPHALINLGETRALGSHPDGHAWRVGVARPDIPWQLLTTLSLADGEALATSAGAGTPFNDRGDCHHLFDPVTGISAHSWKSVTVRAPSAALADGLSTALAVAPPERASRILAHYPQATALMLSRNDTLESAGAHRADG